MIEGLKSTMTGEQLIEKIDARIADYEGDARDYENLLEQCDAQGDQSSPRRCEAEAARSRKRIVALTFIRDYIVPSEVYRLGEFDLRFVDLLPEDDWVDSDCAAFGCDRTYPELPVQGSDR